MYTDRRSASESCVNSGVGLGYGVFLIHTVTYMYIYICMYMYIYNSFPAIHIIAVLYSVKL